MTPSLQSTVQPLHDCRDGCRRLAGSCRTTTKTQRARRQLRRLRNGPANRASFQYTAGVFPSTLSTKCRRIEVRPPTVRVFPAWLNYADRVDHGGPFSLHTVHLQTPPFRSRPLVSFIVILASIRFFLLTASTLCSSVSVVF